MIMLTGNTVKIHDGASSAEFSTTGAYVKGITLEGSPILKTSGDGVDTHGGMAMLLPYANRVKSAKYAWNDREYFLPKNNGQHSIHGLTRGLEWNPAEEGGNSVAFSLRLDNDGYPVPLSMKVSYSISGRSFSVGISAHNGGKIPAPFMAGMHPYFLFSGNWSLASHRRLLRLNYEDGYFPDGSISPVTASSLSSRSELQFDNTFIQGESVSLDTGDHRIEVKTENMPFLVVYNGEYAEGKSVAVEPMSGAPDSYNNGIGLVVIEPGSEYRCSAVFTLR